MAGRALSTWLPRRGERLAPAASGLMLALSFPPLHPLVLPFVGLVPFALWVLALPSDPAGRQAALRGGAVLGSVYFGVLLYWILLALIWFTKLAILAFVATLGVLVGMTMVFAGLLHYGLHSLRAPLWLLLPVTWTALEWIRGHLPSTLAFPWLGLGSSLTGFPELIGIAEIVGSRGVTFWIVLINAMVAALVVRFRDRRPWVRQAALISTLLALPMGWGVWRANTLETRPVGRVAVIQPNIAERLKLDETVGRDSTFGALDRLFSAVEPGSADLVVLPEVVLTLFPKADRSSDEMGRVQAYSRELGVPIVFGGLGFGGTDSTGLMPYNSAFVMKPQGLTDFQYDKRYLVPLAERAPFLPTKLVGLSQYFGAYGVGEGWPLVPVDEASFGVLICYESAYPQASRALRLEGADVLLNITNDAWYGREPMYTRTTALWQHPAHMVLRAIENRVGVARSANTGISLFVDPAGHVYNSTSLFQEEVRVAEVRTSDVVTFYTRTGDWVGGTCAIATFFLLLTSTWAVRSLDRPRVVV
jgi:apolipoprotein N-acyltransferase